MSSIIEKINIIDKVKQYKIHNKKIDELLHPRPAEPAPILPGDKDSGYHRVTSASIVFNFLKDQEVKVKCHNTGTFYTLKIEEVKSNYDMFHVRGTKIDYTTGQHVPIEEWIPQQDVFVGIVL